MARSGQRISLFRTVLIVSLALGTLTAEAAEFRWDGSCMPLNGWLQTCGAGSNWEIPGTPGANDTVILLNGDPITEPNFSFTVARVLADAPVRFDSGETLSLNENSLFRNLQATGGGLEIKNGASVAIMGTSLINILRSDGSAGRFDITGEWSGQPNLAGGAIITSNGEGTVTSTGSIGDGAELINEGTLTLVAGLQGSGGLLQNNNDVVAGGGGAMNLDVPFNNAGNLVVLDSGTELSIRSPILRLQGGTTTVSAGASLIYGGINAGTNLYEVTGVTNHNGEGLATYRNVYMVRANMIFDMGAEPSAAGSGGVVLEGGFQVDPGISLTNEENGRMLFSGEILGSGEFLNRGYATTSPGGLTVGIPARNEGRFDLPTGQFSGRLRVQDSATFENAGTMSVNKDVELFGDARFENETGGEIRLQTNFVRLFGSGRFDNLGGRLIVETDAATFGFIDSTFENRTISESTAGEVRVLGGTARFRGPLLNLNTQGVLQGGRWRVLAGDVDFSRTVTELGAPAGSNVSSRTWLDTDVPLEEFETLAVIGGTAEARFGGGQDFNGDLLVQDGGRLAGEGLDVAGTLTIGDNSGGPPAVFTGSTTGVQPKSGVAGKTKSAAAMAVVQAGIVLNQGVIAPGDRGAIGTMSITGAYEQAVNGKLQIDITAAASDLMEVTGTVSLAGLLEIGRFVGNDPVPGQSYTVLTATGTISGAFDTVLSADPVVVTYGVNSVTVEFLSITEGLLFSNGFD